MTGTTRSPKMFALLLGISYCIQSLHAMDSSSSSGSSTVVVRISDYASNVSTRNGMVHLRDIKNGNDPCAPIRKGAQNHVYTERDANAQCGLAILAFEMLPDRSRGPCAELTRLNAKKASEPECVPGDGGPGYCAVKIPKTLVRVGSLGSLRKKEVTPLKYCTNHLDIQ